MLKQTTTLFIKALIIGALLNIGLQQFPLIASVLSEDTTRFEQQPLTQPAPQANPAYFK